MRGTKVKHRKKWTLKYYQEVRREAREKAPQPCKHRSIAASRQQQLEQKAQEDQTV
jgi:hypothetical protein